MSKRYVERERDYYDRPTAQPIISSQYLQRLWIFEEFILQRVKKLILSIGHYLYDCIPI